MKQNPGKPLRFSDGRRLSLAACVIALTQALSACGAGDVAVVQVDPPLVSTLSDTVISIYGNGFELAYQPLTNATFGDFRVFAGDTELLNPTWIDTTKLEATVPAGVVPLACYAVTVRMEHRDNDATLDNALCVTPD